MESRPDLTDAEFCERVLPACRSILAELGCDPSGMNQHDWNCSWCHRIVDSWHDHCPRCLRSKAVAR